MYINTSTSQYPISEEDIRAAYPNVSFALPFQAPDEYAVVFPAPQPSYDPVIRIVREAAPELTSKGTWEQRWEVVPRFTEYTDDQGVAHTVAQQEAAAIAADQAAKSAALQASIVKATQARLDAFAQTRNYDDIKSACTYAGCSVPKFNTEGSYCQDRRAETWAKLYSMLDEVRAGTRPMPSSFADIEGELPQLNWPI